MLDVEGYFFAHQNARNRNFYAIATDNDAVKRIVIFRNGTLKDAKIPHLVYPPMEIPDISKNRLMAL